MGKSIEPWPTILAPLFRRPGRAVDTSSACDQLALPPEYVELLGFMDGGEGYLGSQYVRFLEFQDAVWINTESPLQNFRDGLFIFGTDGGGEAFAFDQRSQNAIVKVPFIPLIRQYAHPVGVTLRSWVEMLGPASKPKNPALIGKEIHEITPILFGGSPTDPANKTLIALRLYIEVVVWFNNLYRQMRPPGSGASPTAAMERK